MSTITNYSYLASGDNFKASAEWPKASWGSSSLLDIQGELSIITQQQAKELEAIEATAIKTNRRNETETLLAGLI